MEDQYIRRRKIFPEVQEVADKVVDYKKRKRNDTALYKNRRLSAGKNSNRPQVALFWAADWQVGHSTETK